MTHPHYMEYNSRFTLEDFEELVRELKNNDRKPHVIWRFFPLNKEEEDLLKNSPSGTFFIDEY